MASRKQGSAKRQPVESANTLTFTGLAAAGFDPHPLYPHDHPVTDAVKSPGKQPIGKDWFNVKHSEADLARFDAGNYNIGLRCSNIVGLDIDVPDPKLSAKVEKVCRKVLGLNGSTPRRVGKAPKALLPVRVNEPTKGWDIKAKIDGKGVTLFQALGTGKQFVIHGIHPDTHQPYTLDRPLPKREQLKLVTTADLTRLKSALLELFEAEGINVRGSGPTSKLPQQSGNFSPGVPWSEETNEREQQNIDKALRAIEPTCDRETWRDVGMALHDGTHGSQHGLNLFFAWSHGELHGPEMEQRLASMPSSSGSGLKLASPEECLEQWRSYKPGGGITRATLFELARQNGLDDEPENVEVEAVADTIEPIDLWADPPAPVLDLSFLPDSLADYAEAFAAVNGSDPAGIATCLLTASSAVLHRESRAVPYADGHFQQPPVLFSLVLAASGEGKGEAGTNGTAALSSLNRLLLDQYRAAAEAVEGKKDVPKPLPFEALLSTDVTPEGLARALKSAKQFPLYYLPEASRLIAGFGRYSTSGGDTSERAFFNAMYDGGDYNVFRAKGAIVIPSAGCNILGLTTMPQIRAQAENAELDGFFPRFITTYLDPSPREPRNVPDLPKLRQRADMVIFHLFTLGPVTLTLDKEAEAAFRSLWFDDLKPYAAALEGTQPGYAAAVRRLSGRLARFMLIDAAIRYVEKSLPTGKGANQLPKLDYTRKDAKPLTVVATLADFERARRFMQWNLEQVETFYTSLLPSPALTLAQRIGELLLDGREEISRRDIERAGIRSWSMQPDFVRKQAIRVLLDRGWLVDVVERKRRAPARPEDGEAWAVNPLVEERFADRRRLIDGQRSLLVDLRSKLGIRR